MKRAISLFLVLLFICGIAPVVLADETEANAAADCLYQLGLFKGTGIDDNGNPLFDLDRTPTRYEAVTMLVRLLGKEDCAVTGQWSTPFTDVIDWAAPYVGYAYESGLTDGVSDHAYGGEQAVTAAQYITFVLRALGYVSGADFQWDAPWTFSDAIGLTDGTYPGGSGKFTRGDAAIVSRSALNLKLKNSDDTLLDKLRKEGAVKTEETNPALVKAVTLYSVDYETGEWVVWSKTEFVYENGYPKSITTIYPDADYQMVETFDYTFENGVPVSMTRYEDGAEKSAADYVNGRLSQVSYRYDFEQSTRFLTYIYGNDDDYFTLVLHSSHMGDPSDPASPFYNAEEIDEVNVKTEGGLLRMTTNRGLYTNWVDGEDREWMRFNGTYTAYYDDEGILSSTSCKYRDDQTPVDYLFDVTRENGRVIEVIRKTRSLGSDEEFNDARIVFEYTDIPTDAARYSLMINAYILDEQNNFYFYNWY
ncbi:MAG: hypothetical protein IKT07_00820 [Oscillospiraceae bacterium]|nr:hypothetical protein [Oscillospiraceae bacterium]